jgi:1-acyl-sn-glycerol-3-phosphate acyltransferase
MFKTFVHLFILRPILILLFGVNVYGRENLFRLKRYIIVANHNSHLDILLLFYLLPLRQINKTHPVAAIEYFSKSKIIFRLVEYLFDPIWIKRNDPQYFTEFMDAVKSKLDDGHNLIIFPEGSRGMPGEMQHFKTGIGRISEQYRNIPIIPVFLSGTERSLPKRYSIPVPIWNNIIIGPPQLFKGSYKEITHSLEDTIKVIAEKENEGRQKRKTKRTKPIITIAVLGIDGSGKSTLSKNISQSMSKSNCTALVSDTLEFFENGQTRPTQPLITENVRNMVSNYAKNAKSLKQYKIPKLTELLLRDFLLNEIKRWYSPDFIILDGSPVLNLTAWAILYKENYFTDVVCHKAIQILCSQDESIEKNDPIFTDFPELSALKKIKLNNMHLPDMVLFLDVKPKIAIERIDKRGQAKQVHETLDKLSKLRDAYLITCNVIRDKMEVPVCILKGDESIEDTLSDATGFIHKILKEEIQHEESKN